ncbi:MAG TPA: carboxypeptidase regulatory-like domain-containing protein [Myxococcales bacterium]|nr:carboxypeptidase regulatory-like domain-containing protein [Myxococcales bacterium]
MLALAAVTSLGCPERKRGPEGSLDASVASAPKTGPGSIAGEVLFNGQVPPNEPLPKAASEACPQAPAVDERVLVANGRLRNVVVRISGNPPPSEGSPPGPATLELKSCVYRPRVQGAVAGQQLKISNGDAIPHKVNAAAGPQSLFKEVLAPGAPAVEKKLDKGVVKVTCEAHPWEVGYVVVSDNRYFTTTGDTGKFEIKDVPPGSYVLEAWHEKFGTRTSAIVVKPGEATNVLFTFSP